jgi:cysteinyl-tRNA synthetase
MNDDLNTSKALAVVWELVKSDYPSSAKAHTLFKMDRVLGFNLQEASIHLKNQQGIIPDEIKALVAERNALRKQKHFNAADQVRSKINKLGYEIEDGKQGTKVTKI